MGSPFSDTGSTPLKPQRQEFDSIKSSVSGEGDAGMLGGGLR